jgi:hypothetical protein
MQKWLILEELDNIEDKWSQIQDMINNTCEETLGRKSYTQNEWITPETLRKVQERKQKKGAINCSRSRKEKATAKIFYVCYPVFSYTLSNFLVRFVVFCLSCCLFFPRSAAINCTFLLFSLLHFSKSFWCAPFMLHQIIIYYLEKYE